MESAYTANAAPYLEDSPPDIIFGSPMKRIFYILSFLLITACMRPAAPPPGTQSEPVRVKLLFTGDVMQHKPQIEAARQPDGRFDFSSVFEYVRPHFQKADVVIVNLETTLSTSGNYTGYPCFRSPTALANDLREAGVDVAVLANNHCCDGGADGIRTTANALDHAGIRRTGVFPDSLDYMAYNPLIIKTKGLRIALLNYTYSTNGMPVPRGAVVNRIDTVRMARDLAAARSDRADCTVVCIHWGTEYEHKPNAEQRKLASFLHRHGAGIIIGSHPHVIQSFEADSLHVVFYSLGNFVSNQQWRRSDGGLMASVEIVRDTVGRMYYSAEAVPVWVLRPEYRIIPPEVGDTLPLAPWIRSRYEQFMADTRETLYK